MMMAGNFRARLFGTAPTSAWPEPVMGTRTAARRRWASLGLLLAGTLAVAVVSSSVSLRVSAERAKADRAMRGNAALAGELKAMEAELRVRMRLPQLERWNADVLGLKPIEATQFLETPLLLAAYGVPPAAAPVAPALAVLERPAPAAPAVRLVAAPAAPAPVAPPARQATATARPATAAMDPLLVAAVEEIVRAAPAPALTTVAADMPARP